MLFIKLIIVIGLFFLLGKSAQILVYNIEKIAKRFNISIFILGIVLGLLTTTPELFLGINAIIKNIESVSLGNLLGGIIVMFAFLLGLNLVLNKKIKTDGNLKKVSPELLLILLPFIVGLKGYLNYVDGILFLFLYFAIVFYQKIKNKMLVLDTPNKKTGVKKISFIDKIKNKEFLKELSLFIVSLLSLLVLSYFIINLAEGILLEIKISKFIVGLIMFSLGTNLPELMVALKARKNKDGLAINHLMGSGIANVFVLGFLLLFKKFNVVVNTSYLLTLFFTFIVLVFVGVFYKTNKSFSRREGFILLFIYALFIVSQFIFI